MHTDARTLAEDTVIEGDICIVGAGAAGISMAMEWNNQAIDVVLLEGGGLDIESQYQTLRKGESAGLPYYPLDAARLHAFGGTTGHWSGYCAPYEPIDFEERLWIPQSGWPIPHNALPPYYRKAQRLLELGPFKYDSADWEDSRSGHSVLPFDDHAIVTRIWQRSPPTRFGTRYRQTIFQSKNVHLYTHANVCDIGTTESSKSVTRLAARTINGKRHRVRARLFILACGAIQNARLLLASEQNKPGGLGNRYDLVGRYFAEHLEMPAGELFLGRPRPFGLYHLFSHQQTFRGELAPTPATQRQRHLLNGSVRLAPGRMPENPAGLFQKVRPDDLRRIGQWEENRNQPEGMRNGLSRSGTSHKHYNLLARQEQAPNPDSRVTLTESRDALGVPRVRLDWRLTELDRTSMRRFLETLGMETGRSGLGRVRIMDWLLDDTTEWPSFLSGAWHHHGTTRMHADARSGVVNADCRVHGMDNLYIAGSSVFPTAGGGNPTLTIVALSLRLASHLNERVK